jgi:aminoglycoside 3-N-acetyltransferase
MWTQRQLVDDLRDIGLPGGSALLVHASLPAIGPIQGGAATLVAACREVLGADGTLLLPAFTRDPSDADALQNEDALADAVLQHPEVFRSTHPAFAFVAIGPDAEALTSQVPFHYPFGSDGPLARLYQRNGWILLLGVGHTDNLSLHLAEIWANVPYVHRSTQIDTIGGARTTMLGSPECRAGFAKIESLLRQSRILRRGYIGNAESQLMRQQQTVSMAVTMLKGSPSALLCDDKTCRACTVARRMSAEQVTDPS